MKKKIRGFTLVELIIVMFIMTVLMAALMQLMKPIRSTYVDATYYEAQRTTQNGVVQYLTESLRYATNMGIYNEMSGVSNESDAISKFKTATGLTDESKFNIITIDNKTAYTYNNETVYGRLLRSKDVSAGTSRVALGDAYYGKYTYSINVEPAGVSEQKVGGTVVGKSFTGLSVTVSSLVPSSLKQAKNAGTTLNTSNLSGYECVSTKGDVVCLNLMAPVSGTSDALYAGTGTTTSGQNTYIIFTLPD